MESESGHLGNMDHHDSEFHSLPRIKVLGRILKVGVHIFKQGVQGSTVHDLFNPAGPRRSPLFPRETPSRSNFMQSMLTIHLNASLLEY